MDVKPIDVLVRRANGSIACPKLVAFQCIGTRRIFAHLVLCDEGKSIRREDVIEGFVAMCAHVEWGFPQALYRDNGSEYYAFDLIREALAMINDPGARTLVNAKPYAGSSKPIESFFATFDRFGFSQMDGWIGGNRMNQKIQTKGKPRPPYPGNFKQFCAEVQERLRDWEGLPIRSGPLAGRTPRGIYADWVHEGWTPARIDPASLDSAFCKRDTRRVTQGVVSINGTRYNHPELPNGRIVTIALPYRREAYPLVLLPESNGWAALRPEMLHGFWNPSGAVEAGLLKKSADRRVRYLKGQAGVIDLDANRRARIARQVALPKPGRAQTIVTGDDQPHFAKAYADGAAARRAADGEATAQSAGGSRDPLA